MKKVIVNLSLLIIVVASSWSLGHEQFFRAHDYVHAARVMEMFRALSEGQFPVRWSENFGFGYGMPLFEFYAPLPYYIGAALHWLGFSVLAAVKLLFLFSAIFTTWGSFKLGNKLFGRSGGVLTAAAITLAPYRAVNLFVRGALSEAWGIMAMPWVLLGILQLINHEKNAWKTLTAALVVLMLSHNIMTMLFVPLTLLFAVLYVGFKKWVVHKNNQSQLKTLWHISSSLLLAIGLSSFYLFPALLEKDLTQVGSIFAGYFHYSHHFLYIRQFFQLNWGYGGSAWGPDDGISFFLGWGQLLGLSLMTFLIVIRAIGYKNWRRIINDQKIILGVLLSVLLGLALFMSILKSKPLWDALPGLSFAQFPWRFLGVGIIFLGLLVGLGVSLIKSKKIRYFCTGVLFIALLFNARFFQPQEFLDNADDFYYTDVDRIQRQMSGILPDYIPLQMEKELAPPQALAWCQNECDDELEVLVNRAHENLIKTTFREEKKVEFAVADFPGWRVELDGEKYPQEQGMVGNVAVQVPPGEHLVGVLLKNSPVRLWSDVVSTMSLFVLLWLLIEVKKEDNVN